MEGAEGERSDIGKIESGKSKMNTLTAKKSFNDYYFTVKLATSVYSKDNFLLTPGPSLEREGVPNFKTTFRIGKHFIIRE